MVLATENAAGPLPLEQENESTEEFQMVEGSEAVANPTAGNTLKLINNVTAGRGEEKPPATPSQTQNLLNEIQTLRMTVSKHRAENISLDIKASQTERDNEELRVELSRVRMALAKEKAVSAKRKEKYDELLEDVQLGSDKLSKKLVKYKRREDELENQLKEELEAQKVFWQEINQQLTKENDKSTIRITDLKDSLEGEKAARIQEKMESKKSISTLEDKLEDALQDAAEMQIQFERVQVENSKLRKEKTEISTNYENQISKLGELRSPAPVQEDNFSTEDMLRMMQETLGDAELDYEQ